MANDNSNSDDRFDDISLPDMEASWQKMKSLLDKQEKGRKPLVPFSFRSCALIAVVLLTIGFVIWKTIIKHDDSSNTTTTKSEVQTSIEPGDIKKPKGITEQTVSRTNERSVVDTTSSSVKSDSSQTISSGTSNLSISKTNLTTTINSNNKRSIQKQIKQKKTASEKNNSKDNPDILASAKTNQTKKESRNQTDEPEIKFQENKISDTTTLVKENAEAIDAERKDQIFTSQSDSLNKSKSITIPESSKNTQAKGTTSTVDKTSDKKKKRSLIFSAGIALQQAIPIKNQKSVSYDYNGKKSILSDYTPSVYLRLEKKQKWFLQAEYKYNAAHAVEGFSYSRRTKLADSGKALSTTNYYLRKTYYHQIPVSFHYYILPHVSVGTGIIYNTFHGAVIEKQVTTRNFNTQNEAISKEIYNIKQFNDSFFFKTQIQWLFQTEYQWKRFTLGLRYTADLQPYIRYTKPDGEILSRKNNTLQALIRFRLWQQKKK